MKTHKLFLALFALFVMGMESLLAQVTKDDYVNSYLTIESLADNDTIRLSIPAEITSELMTSVSYSTDGTNWTTLEVNATAQIITVVLDQGGKVYFKGLGKQCSTEDYTHIAISGSGNYITYGNIMSLLYGDSFASHTEFPEGSINTFTALFIRDDNLVSAENLVLPATTAVSSCYYFMFYHCDLLTTAPALPATTLEEFCYTAMFSNCISLTAAPNLPATTMAMNCYRQMFEECTSLVEAPALPATTLADLCYMSMFSGCTSLNETPALPATSLRFACYYLMFHGCESLTTAPELPATELAQKCYYNMFF